MATIALASYTLRVRAQGSKDYLPLSNFHNRNDLFPIFGTFFSTLMSRRTIDYDEKKIIGVKKTEQQGRHLYGLIETGEFGFSSELFDTKILAIAHQRSIDEAEMLPFFFMIHVPEQRDKGIIILQRFGTRGIRKILLNQFQLHFRRDFQDFICEILPLAPEQLFSQQLKRNGRVTKLRFVRFGLPSDIANHDIFRGHEEEIGTVELVVSVKRNRSLPIVGMIQDWLDGRREIPRLIEFTGFDYDVIKCQLTVNGRLHTIELSAERKFRAHYDITNRVETGTNGHPLYDQVKNVSQEWLESLLSTLYRDTP